LKRGATWLDYRSIYPASAWTGDLPAAGVAFDEPVDPTTKIEALLSVGEGPQVEYKEKLVTSGNDRRNLKTIPALANENGGTIVFGMHQDDLTRVGIKDGDRIPTAGNLANLIHSAVEPAPQLAVSHHVVDGKTFFIVEVAPGQSPPYGLIVNGARDKQEYYVRRGASTYLARPADLREIVMSRLERSGQATIGR
jgi:predicted HTH transcriptional regulator